MSSFGVWDYLYLWAWCGGWGAGWRSFDIWEGSNPTAQILPGMGEKMNSMKNKNGLGKNFIHVRANLSQVAASQVEGLAQAGIKKFAQ